MPRLGLLLSLLFLSAFAPAQEWVKRYLPAWANHGGLRLVSRDGAGGIVAASEAHSDSTHLDFLTVRFAAHGDVVWERRYDNSENSDWIRGMVVAPDGRVVVCGKSWQDGVGGGGDYDWAVVSYRSNGDTAWTIRYSPGFDGDDDPQDIAMDAAGNVIVTGAACFRETTLYWPSWATLFIDAAGVVRWVAQSEENWVALCVAIDSAGCVYVGGLGGPHCTHSRYVKYGPDGVERWRVKLANPYPYPCKAAVGRDGAVYFAGVKPSGPKSDYWLAKFDTGGCVLWERTYDGPGQGEDVVWQMALDESCNVYVTGWSRGSGTHNDICTVSWDSEGNQRWVARYGKSYSDLGYGLCLDRGFVYVAGELSNIRSERSDACLLKYSAHDGLLQWARTYDGPAGLEDEYAGVCVGQDGRVYVVGYSMRDSVTLDWEALLACYPADGSEVEEPPAPRARPEPAGRVAANTLVLGGNASAFLLDAAGRRVQALKPGPNDVRSLAPGVYFVMGAQAQTQAQAQAVRKIILTR